jgi:hypothetical protein
MLTLSIRGLSAVTLRQGGFYEVLFNPTTTHDGMNHDARQHVLTLAALTKFLDPPAMNRLDPDVVNFVPVFDQNGDVESYDQIAIWKLTGQRITLVGGTGRLGRWADRSVTIDLSYFHRCTQTVAVPNGFGVLELREGQPSSESAQEFTLLDRQGTRPIETGPCAREVRWTGLPMEISVGGNRIVFNPASGLQPVAVLTNSGNTPGGLEHFAHYYDVVIDANGQAIGPDAKISLSQAGPEIYDCVPPVAAP